MSMQLQIPDAIVQAIRLPEGRIVQELLVELAFVIRSGDFVIRQSVGVAKIT